MTAVVASGSVTTTGAGDSGAITPDVFAPGIYQLYLDTQSIDSGDQLRVDLATSINGTSTMHNVIRETISGPQSLAVIPLLPIISLVGISLDWNQIAGAAFSFSWRLDRLGTPQYVVGGRQLTVVGSTHTLATIVGVSTSPYVLIVSVDLSNAGPTDQFEVTVYTKVLSSSSESGAYLEQISMADPGGGGGARAEKIFQLPPIDVPYEAVVTLKHVNGNAQNVDWQVVTI